MLALAAHILKLHREKPTFHSFLEWVEMIVDRDLSPFPEVRISLREALPSAWLISHSTQVYV